VPIEYTIDHEHRVVRARGSGVFTDDEVFAYQREVWSRPDVAGYDELIDMTNVIRIALPSIDRLRDLATLAAEMDQGTPPAKFAIVAPGDVAYMLGRLYKAIHGTTKGSTRRVGVFRTLPEALAFLGLAS
jgi:hypothetical protein